MVKLFYSTTQSRSIRPTNPHSGLQFTNTPHPLNNNLDQPLVIPINSPTISNHASPTPPQSFPTSISTNTLPNAGSLLTQPQRHFTTPQLFRNAAQELDSIPWHPVQSALATQISIQKVMRSGMDQTSPPSLTDHICPALWQWTLRRDVNNSKASPHSTSHSCRTMLWRLRTPHGIQTGLISPWRGYWHHYTNPSSETTQRTLSTQFFAVSRSLSR